MSCEFFKRNKIPVVKFASALVILIPVISAIYCFSKAENFEGYLYIESIILSSAALIAGYMIGIQKPCGLIHVAGNMEVDIEGMPNNFIGQN